MAYTTIIPVKAGYTPLNLSQAYVNPDVIFAGSDCAGSVANQFSDGEGLQVRNQLGRMTFIFENKHSILDAYARIVTPKTVFTLGVQDILIHMPAGSGLFLVGGFSNIFHTKATIQEEPLPDVITNYQYNDIIQINFSHDASDPTNAITFGAYYV